MNAKKIADSVYCIHADINDGTSRFEGLWELPHGVSINSYIVKGEKTALIDIVKDWDGSLESFRAQLASLDLDFSSFDYIILNHMEPDHADLINLARQENPSAEVIATAKGIAMVEKFFKITDNLRAVKNGDTLDLGGGKVLTFYETPNIHWPETMMTYLGREKILFSCDAFGSYGCIGDKIFDDERTPRELDFYADEALRYYANIVAGFSLFVNKGLAKLQSLEIGCICPSHGLVWRKNPLQIINLYKKLASYNTGGAGEKEIYIIWGSMYGYTRAGIDALIAGIESENVPYTMDRVPDTDPAYILANALRAGGIVIAMPTYEYKMFPPMAYILDLFCYKHITNKKALRIGNWGWLGGAKRDYEARTESLKWTHIEPYEWQGKMTAEDAEMLKARGAELARAVKESV